MILGLIILILIAIGGAAVTYLIEDDEPLLWRLAAGCVIGSAVFGLSGFVLGFAFGITPAVAVATLLITLLPLILLLDESRRKAFDRDRILARGKLQGATGIKFLRFFYYACFLGLLILFFDRAIIINEQGIFTGGSNNLGDLPFHLGAIYAFTEGASFPPDNPNFAGVKFTYPFIADLITAMFMKLGVGVREAMLVQNVAWAFSLLVVLERLVLKLVGDTLAAKLAPVLLFLSGGLGFVVFFGDYFGQSKGLFELIWNLPKDYTIGDQFRWGNSLTTLFLTQRSLLLGMPIALIAIGAMWRVFGETEDAEKSDDSKVLYAQLLPYLLVGLAAGTLPLIHVHSLAVLFVVGLFALGFRPGRWRELLAFALGTAVIAVPLLAWSMTGSATRTSEFIGFHFGWDKRDDYFLWFWLKNTGLLLPLLATGIYLVWTAARPAMEKANEKKKASKAEREADAVAIKASPTLLLFYVPFAVLFVVSNVFKFAPWEWDNIKILIYWYVMSLPFVVLAIAWLWRRLAGWKAVAAVAVVVLTMSGGLDVWRTLSGQINYRVFEPDAVTVANRIRASTRPDSVLLNAPTYNSAVVLSGRASFMRYAGHLGSHGIDYKPREEDLKTIYRGGPQAEELIRAYGITHVLISPEERNTLSPNEQFFARYPVIAESGQYRVYKLVE
ncbi:MAG: hypothetical protein IPM21_11895 [Acidobacteria bacterium]|nr:hypothetical protein [Acidobacteriota bacterium]